MTHFKILATDLDGTLLTHSRKPHPEAADAIRRAQGAGILVAIATGRILQSAQIIAQDLQFAGPIIACNGANVVDGSGRELRFLALDPKVVSATYQYAAEKDLQLCAYTRDGVYFLKQSPWGEVYRSRINLTIHENVSEDHMLSVPCLKVMLIDSPDLIRGHREFLSGQLTGIPVSITESEPEYLEFLPAGADKGSGLRILAETVGADPSEIAAIGDYLNDIEMLAYAGFSAAVGNAVNQVKELVNVVVKTNEEGGFAEFVDQFVLKSTESELS